MVDISMIDQQYIEHFNFAWLLAQDIFKVSPTEASPRVQKKIRKWLEKTYIQDSDLPPEVMGFVTKDVTDGDLMAFLQSCRERFEESEAQRRQAFETISTGLGEDVRQAIWDLNEKEIYNRFQSTGNEARLRVELSEGYDQSLIFIDPEGIPQDQFDYLTFDRYSFRRTENGYTLSGQAVNWETDEEHTFTLRFTDVNTEIISCRADIQSFSDSPWQYLCGIARTILEKSEIIGAPMNEKETALLPLAAEIIALRPYRVEPPRVTSLPLLCGYIQRHGFTELLAPLKKLERHIADDKKRAQLAGLLNLRINNKKYEPLWREIYGLFADSQSRYPVKSEMQVSPESLAEFRQKVQKLMEARGYSGTYPDFEKRISIKGLRGAQSYMMDYIVGQEKNVKCLIHCIETCQDGEPWAEFLCGTELLKKGEKPGDIYSCTFNARGRRFFHTVSYFGAEETLEQRVEIAAKRAELRRLTKEERRSIFTTGVGFWSIFLGFFLIGGALFAILYTLGMMLFSAILTVILAGFSALPGMFTDIPWMELFGMAWVLFGGAMGLITALGAQK